MCDCEYPEFFNHTVVRGRKTRRCYECGSKIDIGEKYHRSSGRWFGEFSSFATCDPCEALRKRLSKDSDCCIVFGGIGEELCEIRGDKRCGRDGREFWKRMKRAAMEAK